MVDAARHPEEYVWIDPPWELQQEDSVVATSAQYPEHDIPDYLARHEAWGHALKRLLDGAVLEAARVLDTGTVELSFRDGMRLVLADGAEPVASLWYDDWYAKS